VRDLTTSIVGWFAVISASTSTGAVAMLGGVGDGDDRFAGGVGYR
jgi:hypothetical protein